MNKFNPIGIVMKLKKSAATTFLALCLNCLLFNHAFAMSSETASCNQALEKGDVESALTIASKALSKDVYKRQASFQAPTMRFVYSLK